MIIYYDNVDLLVNNTGILANAASINSINTLEPAYVLGNKGIINISPNGPIKSTISISYFPEVDKEPSYGALTSLKTLTNETGWTGIRIELANITGYNCYLTSYTLRASPNEITSASVTYDTFVPLSGDITAKRTGISYHTNDRWLHGWTAYVTHTGDYLTDPTYEFEYNFNAQWEPVYVLGQKFPIEVHLRQASERIAFVRDSYKHIQFSGEHVSGNYITGNSLNINMMDISWVCGTLNSGLLFNVSGAKISETLLSVVSEEFVRNRVAIQKFY